MSFQVDLDLLEAAVTRLEQLEATVEKRLADLDHELTTLHGTWSGEAAAAQAKAHARWEAAAVDMRQALGRLRVAGAHAHTAYTRAVTANTQTWSQTR